MTTEQGRLFGKPPWVDEIESRIAARIPLHPNWLSAIKLLVITPGMVLALRQIDVLPGGAVLVTALFVVFFALDYLDGVVARGRSLDSCSTCSGRARPRTACALRSATPPSSPCCSSARAGRRASSKRASSSSSCGRASCSRPSSRSTTCGSSRSVSSPIFSRSRTSPAAS